MSTPGDPVVMNAAIEGISDNPSPMGATGSGAAVEEVNMALSLTSEAGPRFPERISADNPNSSADVFKRPVGRNKGNDFRRSGVRTWEKGGFVGLTNGVPR